MVTTAGCRGAHSGEGVVFVIWCRSKQSQNAMAAPSTVIKFVRTQGLCILKQLRLEESLFRVSNDNWVIANDGTDKTAIVLGISGKPHHLIDVQRAYEDNILTIKRYTGGGTVVVDKDTQFVSFILNGNTIPHIQLFPVPLMRWTSKVYKGDYSTSNDSRKHSGGVFRDVPTWHVHQNDYVIGGVNDDDDGNNSQKLKVGGNAQSISKHRFTHHTSFLWAFSPENMRYLKLPKKQPEYRANRPHGAFLAPLCEYLPERGAMFDRLPEALTNAIENVTIEMCSLADAEKAASSCDSGKPSTAHRSTAVVDLEKALSLDYDARAPVLREE